MAGTVTKVHFLLILWLPSSLLGFVIINPEDPHSDLLMQSDFVPQDEPFTNLTIDQLISQAYENATGGDYMADYFMEPDGTLLAELDMRLDPEQFAALYDTPDNNHRRKKRKATRPERYRWTNAEVPYEFYSGHFSANEVYMVKQALQEWMDATCVTFRPATSGDRNRVRFQNGAGCNSMLGMTGGTQAINLQAPSCRYKGLYLHEVGHALGLVHEHQLPDRDKYITILYNNVSPSMRIWFNKYTTQEVNQYGVPFEYSSVMHYGVTAFSSNGRSQTIRAKDPSREAEIGRVYLKGLSFSDKKVVNLMYKCNERCEADPKCNDPGYLDKNCKCVCPKNIDCGTGTGTGTGGGGVTDGGGIVTVPACTDTWPGSQCRAWANRNECTRNPDWMLVNCQRSCNSCPTAGPRTTTTTTTTTTTPRTTTYMPSPRPSSTESPPTTEDPSPTGTTTTTPECINQWPGGQCTSWAGEGACVDSPDWMGTYCQVACNACPEGSTTAPPVTTPSGPTVATTPSGPTTPTTTYMPSPPPSSTTTTTTTTTTRPTTRAPCVNTHRDSECTAWASRNECTINPSWMRPNCAKACGVCTGGGGTGGDCQNRNSNCNYWSRAGYCSTNEYMTTHCRRACNLCS